MSQIKVNRMGYIAAFQTAQHLISIRTMLDIQSGYRARAAFRLQMQIDPKQMLLGQVLRRLTRKVYGQRQE